jgi:hypothetical protein
VSGDRPTFVSGVATVSGGHVHRLRALAGNSSRGDVLYMLPENIAVLFGRFAEVGSSNVAKCGERKQCKVRVDL